MSSVSVSTSSKVIVLRKGKRKKPAQAGTSDQGQEEEENEFDVSESSSSEEEPATPALRDSTAQRSTTQMLSDSTRFPAYATKPGFAPIPQATGFSGSASFVQPHASHGNLAAVPASGFQGMPMMRPNLPMHAQDFGRMEPSSSAVAPGDEDEDEEEDEELTFSDTEENIRNKLDQTREQMKLILQNFTPEQMQRYEKFRRVGFSRNVVKKIMHSVLGHSANPNTVIVMSGIAKVFVGELVEEAKDVMEEWDETGPIMPSHLMEAHRRLKARYELIPHCNKFRNKKIL